MPDIATLDAAAVVRGVLGIGRDDLVVDVRSSAPLSPGQELQAWDDDRVIDALVSAEALARQLETWRAALAVQVEQRSARAAGRVGLAQSRGCRNARELLRRVTGAADASVSRWLRLGRATHEPIGLTGAPLPAPFPRVAAALAEGRIGPDAALRIVDTLNPLRATVGAGPVAVAEEEIVAGCVAAEPDGVCPVDADSVRIQAATWAAFLDQDGAAPPDADLARRSLRLGGVHHGLVRLTGLLMPEVAAALRAFADSCTNPRTPQTPGPTGADDDQIGAPRGDEPDGFEIEDPDGAGVGIGAVPVPDIGPSETRTGPQLMHDVLAAALGAAARVSDQSSLAGNSPTVLVAVRREDLATGQGSAAAFTGDAFGAPAPISVQAARQLACAGAIQRVVLDEGGAVIGLGSAERCFTGHQRRAIALRDGGCIIPGCHVPAAWCEVHHVTAHADDGPTHTDNGTLLCWYHHRTIETSGWQIRMRHGLPEVRPPDWLRAMTRTPSDDGDDGWRRATGSPTRFLGALHARARSSGPASLAA